MVAGDCKRFRITSTNCAMTVYPLISASGSNLTEKDELENPFFCGLLNPIRFPIRRSFNFSKRLSVRPTKPSQNNGTGILYIFM